MALVSATNPYQSLLNQSAGATVGGTLDNGITKNSHSLIVIAGAGVSAGVVTLEVSPDNVNWTLTSANFAPALTGATPALAAPGVYGVVITFPAQFVRAVITTAVVGGTVTAFVASA